MSLLTTTLVAGHDDDVKIHPASEHDSWVTGRVVHVSVHVGELTIQSHYPGALARIGSALIAAENDAETLRAQLGLPTSVEPQAVTVR